MMSKHVTIFNCIFMLQQQTFSKLNRTAESAGNAGINYGNFQIYRELEGMLY